MKDWFYHMSKLTIPQGYRMPLSNNELQRAIELIHEDFQRNLTLRLNLHRVSAPLFVDGRTGLNDDLNGLPICMRNTVRCLRQISVSRPAGSRCGKSGGSCPSTRCF